MEFQVKACPPYADQNTALLFHMENNTYSRPKPKGKHYDELLEDCLIFAGHQKPSGHCAYWAWDDDEKTQYYIHRALYCYVTKKDYHSWEKVVTHRCDVPNCVRLSHLKEGTVSSNLQESYDRGLKASLLTKEEAVKAYMLVVNRGRTIVDVGNELKQNPRNIANILYGVAHKKAVERFLGDLPPSYSRELKRRWKTVRGAMYERRRGVSGKPTRELNARRSEPYHTHTPLLAA